MLSHIYISVDDFPRAMSLYGPLMELLNLGRRLLDPSRPWVVWESPGKSRPFFIVGLPFNGQPHDAGNGQMVALLAETRDIVDQAYSLALGQGCKDEGSPALRPHYHANYYGAYFRDHSGNKLCVVCHAPELMPED